MGLPPPPYGIDQALLSRCICPPPRGVPGPDLVAAIREEHAAIRLAQQSDPLTKAKADDAKSVAAMFASSFTRILDMHGILTLAATFNLW